MIDRFIDHIKRQHEKRSPSKGTSNSFRTARGYRADLEQAVEYFGQLKPGFKLENVAGQQLKDFVAWLESREYRPLTIQRKRSALSSFYNFCCQVGVLKINPLTELKLPKVIPDRRRYLTTQQIQGMLSLPDRQTLIGARDYAMFKILFDTGMRIQELVGLTTSSIDFDNHAIKIIANSRYPRRLEVGETSIIWLRHYLALRREQDQLVEPSGPLWINCRGQALGERAIRRRLCKYAKKIGLADQVCPKVFRCGFAVEKIKNGASLEELARLLGQDSLRSTSYYAQAQPLEATEQSA